MNQIPAKAEKWIKEDKDPRSARWQAALEEIIALASPLLEKGKLIPVSPLEDKDLPVFNAALQRVDLSPGLLAAFFPPPVADPILPPDAIDELVRIEKGKPSYKIIILRPGSEERILCAEISEHAHRPGVDIFQSGAFLGNFDYDTHENCISELTKTIRAHAWEKGKWTQNQIKTYTLTWFEKTVYFGNPDVSVLEQYSYFHSPTLVRMSRVDAMFMLIYETLVKRFKKDHEMLKYALPGTDDKSENRKGRRAARESIAETHMLELLNLIKQLKIIDFATFTNAESYSFQNEFARTVRKLSTDMEKMTV